MEQGERQERPVRDAQAVMEVASKEPRRSYFTTSQEVVAPVAMAVQEVPAVVVQTPEATSKPVLASEIPATSETAPLSVAVAKPLPTPMPVVAPAATVPVAPALVAAPVPLPIEIATGMPKVQSFVLPLGELAQVAESSGLSWVNSDASKIAAVQAGIAAEPKVVHVPRVRPAVTPTQEGPLVLVETKRDLKDLTLPFEVKGVQ
jgi:ribonuclease E